MNVESDPFDVEAAAGDPSSTTATVPADGTVGESTTITITVEDEFGNRVEGVEDELSVSINGANNVASVDPISDDGNGIYSASYAPSNSGTDNIEITLDETEISGGPYTSDVSAGSADAGESEINAAPASIPADGASTSTVTVQLRDAGGNALASGGDNVGLSTTAGTLLNSLSDNADGTYSQELQSSASAETATVTGTLDGDVIGSVNVVFEALQASQISSLTIADAEIPVDGSTTVTATVLDTENNPIEGVTVSFGSNEPSRATVDAGSALTDENGLATVGVTGATDEPGPVTITASISAADADVATSDSETVDLTVVTGGASASESGIEADRLGGVVADGSDSSELTITVRDGGGNELVGEDVFFSVTSGSGALSGSSWSTDGSGQATAALTSTEAGTVSVTGYLGSNTSGDREIGAVAVDFEDNSEFTLTDPGNQTTDEAFFLEITGAQAVNGDALDGSVNVTVTSNEDGEVHNDNVTFSGGVASVPLTLTTAATHTLNRLVWTG